MEESIRKGLNITSRQLETYSPLTLAFLGDSFYELIIRTYLSETAEGSAKVHAKKASELARAVTQAKMSRVLLGMEEDGPAVIPTGSFDENSGKGCNKSSSLKNIFLTSEEVAVFKRGRNANTTHGAKGATTSEYRLATGFEALIGWLYLQNKDERIYEIVSYAWERI